MARGKPAVSDGVVAPDAHEAASVSALVQGAGAGDQRCWDELVGRFAGMIACVGRRYGLNASDVGELQQTTWLRLVENLDRIESPERIGGWLATTARRESLHMLSRSARYCTGADELLSNRADDSSPDVDARPLAQERDRAVRAAFQRLRPRCQELLGWLMRDDAPTYLDIARLLDMPIGSIGPTRGRCLEHLKRLIAEEDPALVFPDDSRA